MLGRARAHERREAEEESADPCGDRVAGANPRIEVHRVAAHHAAREHEHVERLEDAEQRDERIGEDVGEGRVVVQRERHRRAEREDFGGQKRQAVIGDDLVPEHPEVPDVHTGITVWQPQHCVRETQRQGPRKHESDTHVS